MTFPKSALATVLPGLTTVPVVGIVRKLPPSVVEDAVAVAINEGLRCLELTLDSPDVLRLVSQLRRTHPEVHIGVGSVTRSDQVGAAHDAGAEFVVSPLTNCELIAKTLELDLPVFPGAATPTEIDLALRCGASAVKVFPVTELGGPGYLRAIRSPLGNPALVPTGGISAEDAPEYFEAGAIAIGAGSDLFSAAAIADHGLGHIKARASAWVRAVS